MTTMACYINSLPDEILEYILNLIPPYKDLTLCTVVCKRWYHAVKRVIEHKQAYFERSVAYGSLLWSSQSPFCNPEKIGKRHSHSACTNENSMYIFGGCTKASTTFNDLWKLDLDTREWERPMPMGNYPSPKAYSSMVYYKKSFIVFGGWASPSSYPIYQRRKLFDELHIYSTVTNTWTCIEALDAPPATSAHSATVHGNIMVVFGGVNDFSNGTNKVWCLNLDTNTWQEQLTFDPKPHPRYGQSQIFLDEKHLLIIGGCTGPNVGIDDAWVLTLEGPKWRWNKVTFNGREWAPMRIWCHQACKVGDHVVLLSKKRQSNQANNASKESKVRCHGAVSLSKNTVQENKQRLLPALNPDENVNGRRGEFPVRLRHRQLANINPKKPTNVLSIFILNIAKVLSDEHIATWIQHHGIENTGPAERILYSLVLGRGELIMFGGVHKMSNNSQSEIENSEVYNDIHFIKPPRYAI
ncbi:hypothetical protein PV325_009641 [Microctonus aethiopoides]|uniref:F-box domain-containing protein n=1 Tax=Microctonus aethiopoides TaxID=144406 RepID=A0AA39FMR5_9HYME|nr:hypothetical protein PV325_009641 [Microctonus aethiopoides]KAK0172333.1 hypothetical protein PV328_005667 [Microctonus aethiopoides]